ncbi:hypothetical protein M422DRAFT_172657, partial [Sphaerobolus stellatus SS14]
VFRKGKSSLKGSAILLTGPSDAGKTAIHSALVYGKPMASHTSLQSNVSVVTLPSSGKHHRTAKLIDIPGHPRIRDQFKDHLSDAKAVIFVVDASAVARNGASIAEYLHHIFHAITTLPPSQTVPPIVILAHKFDLVSSSAQGSALAVSRVRNTLERELEKRRSSQAGGVGVGQLGEDEGGETEMGGLECSGPVGSGFKFKDWEGGEVEILGTSATISNKSEDPEKAFDGLAELKQWLQELP